MRPEEGPSRGYEHLPAADLAGLLRSLARTTSITAGNRTEEERAAILLGAANRLDEIDREARRRAEQERVADLTARKDRQ